MNTKLANDIASIVRGLTPGKTHRWKYICIGGALVLIVQVMALVVFLSFACDTNEAREALCSSREPMRLFDSPALASEAPATAL